MGFRSNSKAPANVQGIRLLFDGVVDGSPGGNHLQKGLVRAIGRTRPDAAHFTVLLRHGRDESLAADGVGVVRVAPPSGGWFGRLRWYRSMLPELVEEHEANVIYSLSGILSRPLVERCGTITSVNNMLSFTPRSMQNYRWLPKERLRHFLLHHLYIRSLELADAVLLHSKHALDLLSQYADGIVDKTQVVHSGIPSSLEFDALSPPPHPYEGKPYLFYLSAIYPYKNHQTLIQAYSQARRAGAELPELLIAGFPSDPATVHRIEQQIRELGLEDRARYLGPLPRAEIPAWLHHATVNVFPSPCETSAMVLAEVMHCNGVLACADAAPMPEIVADAAALFDAYDAEGLGQLLVELSANEERRQALRELAAERKTAFSWDACGEAIWEAARRAAAAFDTRAGVLP